MRGNNFWFTKNREVVPPRVETVPFYYDQDDRVGDRLFIRDARTKGCYIVYDKQEEDKEE